jgi:DNA-binding NtrC family response regulator
MSKPDLILLALEDSSITRLMDSALHAVKYETAIATDTPALSRILQEANPALLLIGEKFDGHDSLKISKELLERFPTLPILIYSQKPSVELTKGIFRLG